MPQSRHRKRFFASVAVIVATLSCSFFSFAISREISERPQGDFVVNVKVARRALNNLEFLYAGILAHSALLLETQSGKKYIVEYMVRMAKRDVSLIACFRSIIAFSARFSIKLFLPSTNISVSRLVVPSAQPTPRRPFFVSNLTITHVHIC